MSGFVVDEFSEFDEFVREWDGDDGATSRMIWQLLGELSDDELLIKLPEWLAEEKVGYTKGSTPTEFVGRIGGETEQAVRFVDTTAARPLKRLAHRITALEDGIENAAPGDNRRPWLRNRLRDKHREFATRDEMAGLREEWIPKSQIIHAVVRTQ